MKKIVQYRAHNISAFNLSSGIRNFEILSISPVDDDLHPELDESSENNGIGTNSAEVDGVLRFIALFFRVRNTRITSTGNW